MTREGPGGLQFFDLSNPFGEATICSQGAQLIQWQHRSSPRPVMFVADAVQYVRGKSLRAGIPICWPWFGPHPAGPPMPQHGFARNLTWDTGEAQQLRGGATRQAFVLRDDDTSRALWPHPFRLEYQVTVGDTLVVELASVNVGNAPFSITEALHAYFLVADVGAIEIQGLDSTYYSDKADGAKRKLQQGAVTFAGEVDRVFLDTEADCSIVDPVMQRRIVISTSGSRSTVIWNPGAQKAAGLADLGDVPAASAGWRQMVCVESANALDNRVTIEPGQTHRIAATYRVEPLSGAGAAPEIRR